MTTYNHGAREVRVLEAPKGGRITPQSDGVPPVARAPNLAVGEGIVDLELEVVDVLW